jgi:hypothetical protein
MPSPEPPSLPPQPPIPKPPTPDNNHHYNIPSSPPLISQLSPSIYTTHFLTGFEDATFNILKTKGAHVLPAPRDRGYVGYAEEPKKDAYRQGYNLALAKAIVEEGVNEGDAGGDWRTWMWRRWTGTEW